MSACKSQAITTPSEDEEFLLAMEMNALIALPFVSKATIEMGILEIMAECGPMAPRSPAQIASSLSGKNPRAPETLDRILQLLASYSIVFCTPGQDTEGNNLRLYGLGPKSKHFVRAHGTATFAAPLLLMLTDKIVTAGWFLLLSLFLLYSIDHVHHHVPCNPSLGYTVHASQVLLKMEIIEGGDSFKLANGLHVFEYTNKDKRFNEIFNNAMQSPNNMYMSKIVESYHGFDNVKTVVNVGGGVGASLRILLSEHPHIHGADFDLTHVVEEAPPYPGIEYVGGDMTNYIPKADVILIKRILHGADDKFVKLLKNCWEALPEKGKVVIVDAVLLDYPKTNIGTRNAFLADMAVLNISPGGKDRTEREFEVLVAVLQSRWPCFNAPKLVCRAYNMWVIELYK